MVHLRLFDSPRRPPPSSSAQKNKRLVSHQGVEQYPVPFKQRAVESQSGCIAVSGVLRAAVAQFAAGCALASGPGGGQRRNFVCPVSQPRGPALAAAGQLPAGHRGGAGLLALGGTTCAGRSAGGGAVDLAHGLAQLRAPARWGAGAVAGAQRPLRSHRNGRRERADRHQRGCPVAGGLVHQPDGSAPTPPPTAARSPAPATTHKTALPSSAWD